MATSLNEIEDILQEEGCVLDRRHVVEDQEQRDGQILTQFRAAVGRERRRVNKRLR